MLGACGLGNLQGLGTWHFLSWKRCSALIVEMLASRCFQIRSLAIFLAGPSISGDTTARRKRSFAFKFIFLGFTAGAFEGKLPAAQQQRATGAATGTGP